MPGGLRGYKLGHNRNYWGISIKVEPNTSRIVEGCLVASEQDPVQGAFLALLLIWERRGLIGSCFFSQCFLSVSVAERHLLGTATEGVL